jgi:aerobactin synthase
MTDPRTLLVDARDALGLDGPTLSEALRELTATWAADAHRLAAVPTAAALADAGYAELESWQGGHPCMVLSKGRLGFTSSDVDAYAPESGRTLRLRWLAVHRDLAEFHGPATLLEDELDDETRASFAARADPDGYVWLPVHPFHLDACVRTLFAPELGTGLLVELGEGPDRYRPLASVRTLVNVDRPDRRDVKVPLLIRNTLVWRGLPFGPTAAAPAISGWLHVVRNGDPAFGGQLDLLGEVASVAVRHPVFAQVADAPYRYHELLGAVWGEPVTAYLTPGERARSLAALTVVGSDGRALLTELVARSGLPPRDWLARLAAAVLPGPLHALHAHGIAFCPHGENTVVVFDAADVPVRVMLKDFAEDVNLLPDGVYPGLPAEADAVLLRWPPDQLAHSILSALVAGVFRFLVPFAARHLDGVTETGTWALIRAEVDAYRARTPELAAAHAAYGLTVAEFDRIALNREQLTGGGFHDRAEKDESFDVAFGRVANPIGDR